jgi:hypothetical protein
MHTAQAKRSGRGGAAARNAPAARGQTRAACEYGQSCHMQTPPASLAVPLACTASTAGSETAGRARLGSSSDLSDAFMTLCGLREAERSGSAAGDRCNETTAGEALKASAPGIETARPAAAPSTRVRISNVFFP